ncbi:MAG: pilus assembly protein PilP [Betaproteobacteria bacterium RBG_16_64_9]|nr:MAG: pilus assembly protein PilP [Betaproteobacteria bacterium RBG_16_64_9]OGA17551.1 MAG: pilus assembly protein PilP [Betaproteobacteria bacterium RIFCSPLOWO2_02_FULL_65_24]OGA80364.1 MAG: pilus assembly protein PilP [Betaproteobacteria bacterium RIFCSPLOWO2_12_FULL_66_14]
MRRLAMLACVLALAACGGEQYGDLKEELNQLTRDMRGKVAPLPVVKPYEPVPYLAGDMPDPFGPTKIELVTRASGLGASKLQPDQTRPKEPLEAFPLETLRMVGVLQQSKQTFGLVKADANLYRVRAGNYMGQNFGLITEVNENEIRLRELIQDAGGDWTERASTLQLQEKETK